MGLLGQASELILCQRKQSIELKTLKEPVELTS